MFGDVLTYGRGLTYIDRSRTGKVINLYPMPITQTMISMRDGVMYYKYNHKEYHQRDIIDVKWWGLNGDYLAGRSPVMQVREPVTRAIMAMRHMARVYKNNGLPPQIVTIPKLKTATGAERAAADLSKAANKAHEQDKSYVVFPDEARFTQRTQGLIRKALNRPSTRGLNMWR